MVNKSAVILWLYHTDLADEFVELLKPHEKYIDIFLGVCKDHDNRQAESLFKDNFSNVSIDYLDNGGTDILPTLNLLEKCCNYQYVPFSETLRSQLLQCLHCTLVSLLQSISIV